MRYNRLGQSGLFVSELCLGTMTFGGSDDMWGQIGQLGQDAADEIVKAAVDGGINFIDTANVYASGRSEEILGQSIRNLGLNREELVIATKVHGQMGEGPNARGASRAHILDQAKKLKVLCNVVRLKNLVLSQYFISKKLPPLSIAQNWTIISLNMNLIMSTWL